MAHSPSVETIDVAQFGEERSGCAYLVRGTKTALIDTGTAASAPRLLEALRGIRLDYAFVTHVHLDHAGGAGYVAREHPETMFIAHERAAPHLVDPGRLAAGVQEASPKLAPLYGGPLAIAQDRIIPCADGQSFDLGSGISIAAVYTPGHAAHHACFFESGSATLFVGDSAGHCGAPVGLPLTVPPRFDRQASRQSIARLLALRPQHLAFAHYGLADDSLALLADYPRRVDDWLAHVESLRRDVGADGVADAILSEPGHRLLSRASREVARLCVQGALRTLDHEARTRARSVS